MITVNSGERITMRPDKKKVINEVWDTKRIKSFLDKPPMGHEANPDYSILLFAYRSMRADDFAEFIGYYQAEGHDLAAQSNAGETLLQTICTHRHAQPFMDILERAAKSD